MGVTWTRSFLKYRDDDGNEKQVVAFISDDATPQHIPSGAMFGQIDGVGDFVAVTVQDLEDGRIALHATLATPLLYSNDSVRVRDAAGGEIVGALTDAVADAGGEGSLSAKLRRLTQGLEDLLHGRANVGPTAYSFIGANTTNAAVVKASAGTLYGVQAFNLAATPVYLKLYNKATTPDENDTPVKRLMIPGNTEGRGFVIPFPKGVKFGTGIGHRLVTGIADNNTTAPTASQQLVNLEYL
jgi:hypothetical protein